jgi:carboxymethylenebutenolidase
MCFPYDSKPPINPIEGAAVSSENVTLVSKDGTEFAAFHARAGDPGGPAVVVMPDVRGLFPFYEELALRFAERGIEAIAIDYFGRTAGNSRRDAEFEYAPHVAETKVPHLIDDVGAAVEVLRKPNPNRGVFTLGFCFGGSNSWIQAGAPHGLAGAIGFYGHPTRPGRDGSPPVIDRIDQIKAPLLGLMGGADQGIPVEEVRKFEAALDKAGREHEFKVYDGAPHSFFDRRFDQYKSECDDAWQRVLSFIETHSR